MTGQTNIYFRAICEVFNTNYEEIASESRYNKHKCARMFLYRYYRQIGYTLEATGWLFNRTHSSVHNALKKLDDLITINDKKTMKDKFLIEQKIKQYAN